MYSIGNKPGQLARRDRNQTLPAALSRDFLLYHRLCPKEWRDDGALAVSVAPNGICAALDDVAFAYRSAAIAVEATEEDVERLIERLTSSGSDGDVEVIGSALDDGVDDDLTADVRNLASQPPVVRYVNFLIRDAFESGASDVHLEATRTGLAARFRIDGVLTSAPEPPSALQHAVISRLKLLAELDIAERRRPQDGRIRVRLEARELDLRVSAVPTLHGESVVMRLLDRGQRPVDLAELGMSSDIHSEITRLADRPHGMLLVTGPTGSGKTTTLYACLARRNREREKVITIEDPIEFEVAGTTQVPVNEQAGVSFDGALRSILRQDPDVLMVGEMRDRETAAIATQAALTGHLVFSTLHTNDALGAIPRLLDLGVPDYMVAASVQAVLAQRLVRRICGRCRESYTGNLPALDPMTGDSAGQVLLHRGVGCSACRGTGFRGRIGIFELLRFTDELRDAIARRHPPATLVSIANNDGMRTLLADGWAKAMSGATTIEEVLRAAQA